MNSTSSSFVRISKKKPQHFELSNGSPFIMIGMNICFQRFITDNEEILAAYRKYLKNFADNGGNFIRVWMGVAFLDLEPEKPGQFDSAALERMKSLVGMAGEMNIRIKFTFDHFRHMDKSSQMESFPGAASFQQTVYIRENGGFADNMQEFLTSPKSRSNFIAKLELLAKHFADCPTIMAWELWNEINAVDAPEQHWMNWTKAMLPELHRLFPNQLALQSLGSFDTLSRHHIYDWLCNLEHNDLNQAHRYLDPGAELDICRGPMDILCADTIKEILAKNPSKPAILAEGGAVEWRHCRMSHLYQDDIHGMLLHDILFAPFFAGSASCGHAWHWGFYVEKNNLWWHFKRFARAVEGIDPASEQFVPFTRESDRLRIYLLKGRTTSLLWCRDKMNTWDLELNRGCTPERLKGITLDIRDLGVQASGKVEFYLPWEDKTCEVELINTVCNLPDFERSIVIKLNS